MQGLDQEGALVLTSAIPSALKRKILKKGMKWAILGLFFLLPGIFFSPPELKIWGLPSLAAALIFIAIGLIPYRKVCDVEKNPYRIRVVGDEYLTISRKTMAITLKLTNIETLTLSEKGGTSGLLIKTNDQAIFLPFFTRRSLEALQNYLTQMENN